MEAIRIRISKKNRQHNGKKKSLKIPKGGNQNPYIEEEQTTQWASEKVQKDKQRSTKHTHNTKDRVTRTPLKPGGALRVNSSCSTADFLVFVQALKAKEE
jgi:hypothetical protein